MEMTAYNGLLGKYNALMRSLDTVYPSCVIPITISPIINRHVFVGENINPLFLTGYPSMNEHVVIQLCIVNRIVADEVYERFDFFPKFQLVEHTHHQVILITTGELNDSIQGTVVDMVVGYASMNYHIIETLHKQVFVVTANIGKSTQTCHFNGELITLLRIRPAVKQITAYYDVMLGIGLIKALIF
jgi:hypothetical protein